VDKSAVVHIRRLQATGLLARDPNGKSDPYIVFHTSPPGLLPGPHPPKTKVQRRTVSPTWGEREIPLLRPNIDGDSLGKVSLICRVYDHDFLSHDDTLGSAVVSLAPPADHDGDAYTVEVKVPVLQHGAVCGELYLLLTVSFGRAVDSALINHKQTIAASPKKSHRERGLSLVSSGLPKTVKLLVNSLDKTTTQLMLRYSKKQVLDTSPHADAKRDHSPSQEINEVDLFLDSVSCIVDRIRSRLQAHPNKVVKLRSPSDMHGTLMKVVQRLIPSAWLWEEHPAYAARHVAVIEHILFDIGVNRWNWAIRAKKADFVPILMVALVMQASGKPIAEPKLATRLVTSFLKAGATSEPYGNAALVARAEQCSWLGVAELLKELDIEGSELRSALEWHNSRASAIAAEKLVDEETALTEAPELHVFAPGEAHEERAATAAAPAEEEPPVVAEEVGGADVPVDRGDLEAAEIAAREAEEKVRKFRAERAVAEQKRLEMVEAMSSPIDDDIADADSDDEHDEILNMDPEELVQRELARLRASMTSIKKPGAAIAASAGAGSNDEEEEGDKDVEEGEDFDDDGDDDDDDEALVDEFDEFDHDINRIIAKLKEAIEDFHDGEKEFADVGSNHFLAQAVKGLSTAELQHKTDGESLLMTAVKCQKCGVVELLAYSGALSKREAQTWEGGPEMYLHEIARQPFDEVATPTMMALLITAGLSPEDIDASEQTAFEVAHGNPDPRVAQTLEAWSFST